MSEGWLITLIALTLLLCVSAIDLHQLLREMAEQWARRRTISGVMTLLLVCGVVWYAGTKPTNTATQSTSYLVTLPDAGLVQSGSAMLSGGISFE